MQGTCSNSSSIFSVIDIEIVETAISFLPFQAIYWQSSLFVSNYSTQCG